MRSNKRRGKAEHVEIPLHWLCLGLGLLILIFYFNSFTAALLFDSESIVKSDPRIRAVNLTNIEQILTRDYWYPSEQSILYRPLTTFSYMFNYAILGNGENVAGYHIINFLLHWANACLVFLILRHLAGRMDIAVLAAALFAVHPVNTEAVTNIVGRADLLVTFGVLSSSWFYLTAENEGRWDKRRLVFAAITACAGVLAKENAVMVVGFVFLYQLLWRWPQVKLLDLLRESWPAYVAFVPALIVIAGIRQWMMSTTTVFEDFFLDNPLVGATPFQRLMTAAGVLGRYLKLLIFPATLSSDYSFNQIPLYRTGNQAADAYAWVSLVLVILLLVFAIYSSKRLKVLSWGILFFFIMLLPTSNLVVTIGSIMAERFLYLPSIGFCAAAAVLLSAFGKPHILLRRALLPAAIVIVALGARTVVRNYDWQDDFTFWKNTVAAVPASYKAHMTYGNSILADADRKNIPLSQVMDEAIAEEQTAQKIIETQPPLPLKWQSVMLYLHLAKDYRMKGQFLEDSGRHDEGVQFYQKSLATLARAQEIDKVTNLQSQEFRRRRGIPLGEIPDVGNYLVYEQLGFTYSKLAQWEKCESAARYLEHIAPQQPSGYELLAAAYFNLGRYSDAAGELLAGFFVDPQKPDWLRNLQAVYDKLGVQPNPVTSEGTGLALNNNLPTVRQQINEAAATLVRLYEEAKRPEEARDLRERLMREYSLAPAVFSPKS